MIGSNYCIYKHTNIINEKAYIGQTCNVPEKRFGKNGNGYKGCRYFYRAIECYGWDNFKHEILETNLSHEEADKLEQKYIKEYKTNDSEYGYNLEGGGRYSKLEVTRKTEHEDEIMKYWFYPKKIAQYDLTDNIIKIWKNTKTASDELEILPSTIAGCLSGRTKIAKGYIFRKIINNKVEHKIDGFYMIGQYTLNGDFIKLWNNIADIQNKLNIYNITLNRENDNENKKSGKYIFYVITDSKNIPSKINGIKVYERYTKSGEFIDSFFSIKEIENKLGIETSGVSKCCSGKLKTHKNHIWKYGILK